MNAEANKTAYIYHPFYLKHETEPHPENPGRLEAIQRKITAADFYHRLNLPQPRKATEDEIGMNHNPAYVHSVKESCEAGATSLDPDTSISRDSYDAALLAAGAGLTAVDLVLDRKCDNVFCAVRPPGHHAEEDRSMGFCLFNNVAVAARYALKKGMNRIFIFDWDVHHGNGTQNSFYTDSRVFYSSVHQYPFYPGTGSDDETGSSDGLGATLNFPLPANCGDDIYMDLLENKLIPEIIRYQPDLIIISAGFDAHEDDPLAMMNVSTECYGRMTKQLAQTAREVCQGRLISMLEGGYNHQALSDSVLEHMKNLLN